MHKKRERENWKINRNSYITQQFKEFLQFLYVTNFWKLKLKPLATIMCSWWGETKFDGKLVFEKKRRRLNKKYAIKVRKNFLDAKYDFMLPILFVMWEFILWYNRIQLNICKYALDFHQGRQHKGRSHFLSTLYGDRTANILLENTFYHLHWMKRVTKGRTSTKKPKNNPKN